MSYREASALALEIVQVAPTLEAEVWAIAEGRVYVWVSGPTTRGVVELVFHDRRELETFLELLR